MSAIITAQEAYFADHTTYTTDQALLNYNGSAGVTVAVAVGAGPPVGYSATTTHTGTAETCAIFIQVAAVAPATNEGEPKCT